MHKFKFLILASLLGIFTQVFAQQTDFYLIPQQKYREASSLFAAEKYSDAQKFFDDLKTLNGLGQEDYIVSDAHYYAALCAVFLYNQDAEYRLSEFIRLYPQNSKVSMAYFYLGNTLYTKKEYTEALVYYNRIHAPDLTDDLRDEYYFKSGYCNFVEEKYDKAKAAFVQVKEGSSKYVSPARYYYAHIAYKEKDYTAALLDFENLKDDSNFGEIVPIYISHIYYLQGRYNDLIAYAPKALEKASPKREKEISRMVGEAYYHKKEYAKAVEYLEPAIGQNPIASESDIYTLAYCHYQLKNYTQAQTYFLKLNIQNDSLAQNAAYLLADCYLKTGDRQAARNAFKEAYDLKFDPQISEDALLNYGKLSIEIPNNAFNEALKAFQLYTEEYPKSLKQAEVNEIMANLYFSVKNYKDALALIEKISPRSRSVNEAYQRIALNRGIEVFNEQKYDEAISLFSKALQNDYDDALTAAAFYLRGEANFRQNSYANAEKDLNDFFVSVGGSKSIYYPQACYTQGYTCLKQKKYTKAEDYFSRFAEAKAPNILDVKVKPDAYNRLGDCNYITKKYSKAIEAYDKNINLGIFDVDYALYQKALSLGALGKPSEKIVALNKIVSEHENSIYMPAVYNELAGTYLMQDNNGMALRNYNTVINKYPNSSYVKEAMLKTGMIQYGSNLDNEALQTFDKVVKTYPNTPEAYDALVSMKNIYVAQNKVDDYFNYVKNIPQTTLSLTEQDSLVYYAAENRYLENDCESSVKGFENYLAKFPDGYFALNASYYKADCLFRQGKYEMALPDYEYVAKQPKSDFTEKSLLNASKISFDLKEYEKAYQYYQLLEQSSNVKTNKLAAKVGIMRSLFRMQNFSKSIEAAENLLNSEKISEEITDEARFTIARSAYMTNDTILAKLSFKKLVKSKNGEYAGEAQYRLAEMLHKEGNLNDAEKAITAMGANPTSEYWLAKSFILWADIFTERGNLFQAKSTLRSIIENYDGEELVREAHAKLNHIEKIEQQAKKEKETLKEESKQNPDVEIINMEQTLDTVQ